MATFGDIKQAIEDELARDDLASVISNAVKAAIRRWEGERFAFNERRYLLSTVASQEYYSWSSLTYSDGTLLGTGASLLEIDSITLTQSSEPYPLTERTQQWMDLVSLPSGQHSGASTDYAIYGDQLRLYPIPDQAYTVRISGLAKLATLSNDEAENVWTNEGQDLIQHHAKLIVYRDTLRDIKGVELATAAREEALRQLKRKYEAKVATNRQRAWGYC